MRAALAVLLALCLAGHAAAALQEPRQAQVLAGADIALTPPPPDATWQTVALPDDAALSRPGRDKVPAWYRIEFDGPGTQPATEAWAAYLPYLYDGGTVWLNGTLLMPVAQSTDQVHARSYRPHMVLFPAPLLRPGLNTLDVRAAPSPSYPLRFPQAGFGPQGTIQPLHDRRLFWTRTVPEITVVGSLFAAVLMGIIWWRRPGELLYGLFGLAAALWGIRTMTFVIDAMPIAQWQWWRVLYHCATGGFIVVMALFTLRFADLRRPWLERALVAYALVGPLWFALQGFAAERGVAQVWLGGMMPIGLLIIAIAFWYVWTRRTLTAAILAGAMAFAVAVGIHDYLITWDTRLLGRFFPQWVGHRVFLLHYGSNTLLLAMGALLTARFIHTLSAVEELNRTLESRVDDRERALAVNYMRLAALESERAAVEERQLIMRDLHDGLGSQLFTSLSRVERGDMNSGQIAEALRACIADMRLALDALASEQHDVGAALGDFMFRWEAQLMAAGVQPHWAIDLPEGALTLSPHAALQVLRVAQEALTNVLKHAGATRVEVRLQRKGDELQMEIEDNGRGIDLDLDALPDHTGRGLANMRARAQRLGGRIDTRSGPAGTCIVLRLPLDDAAPG